MHKIGILSDTHGLLRPEVAEALQGCEVILHGGDINRQQILDDLEKIAPVRVVRGNNDKEWAMHIPETLILEIFGIKIFMVHNKKFIPKDLSDIDLVVYGHSHKYEDKRIGGTHFLNPGSCGPRRFHQEITLAILYVDHKKTFQIQKINISHPMKDDLKETNEEIPSDLAIRLPAIMKDIDSGRTVKQIARKYHLPEDLSVEINRMYLTHPNVDAEGIMRRLGI